MVSILTSIKKLLGIVNTDTSFDDDIIMYINSALMSANQLGVGPSTGFFISSDIEEWTDFVGNRIDLEAIKIYIYLNVRLAFDPPQNSFLVEAIKNQISELSYRLNVQAEAI